MVVRTGFEPAPSTLRGWRPSNSRPDLEETWRAGLEPATPVAPLARPRVPALCQLSYRRVPVPQSGFEPLSYRVSGGCTNQAVLLGRRSRRPALPTTNTDRWSNGPASRIGHCGSRRQVAPTLRREWGSNPPGTSRSRPVSSRLHPPRVRPLLNPAPSLAARSGFVTATPALVPPDHVSGPRGVGERAARGSRTLSAPWAPVFETGASACFRQGGVACSP